MIRRNTTSSTTSSTTSYNYVISYSSFHRFHSYENNGIIADNSDENIQLETVNTPNTNIEKIINLHEEIPKDAEIFTVNDSDDDSDDSDYHDDDDYYDEDDRKFLQIYENFCGAGGR